MPAANNSYRNQMSFHYCEGHDIAWSCNCPGGVFIYQSKVSCLIEKHLILALMFLSLSVALWQQGSQVSFYAQHPLSALTQFSRTATTLVWCLGLLYFFFFWRTIFVSHAKRVLIYYEGHSLRCTLNKGNSNTFLGNALCAVFRVA